MSYEDVKPKSNPSQAGMATGRGQDKGQASGEQAGNEGEGLKP